MPAFVVSSVDDHRDLSVSGIGHGLAHPSINVCLLDVFDLGVKYPVRAVDQYVTSPAIRGAAELLGTPSVPASRTEQ